MACYLFCMNRRGWQMYFECLCSDQERGVETTTDERQLLAEMCRRGNVFWRCTFGHVT